MRISIIGTGKVAVFLALTFRDAGYTIEFVYGRNIAKAKKLARVVKAKPISKIRDIESTSDLYIICVSDNAIKKIAGQFRFFHLPVVHTSGASSMEVLKKFKQHGVFYPLLSINNSNSNKLRGTPVLIESTHKSLTSRLSLLARKNGAIPYCFNYEKRLTTHLAAVIANNFSNSLYQAAYDLLARKKIPFSIIHPLIDSTIKNISGKKPAMSQTGPAARKDSATMKRHIALLKQEPRLKKIYKLLSALIETQQEEL